MERMRVISGTPEAVFKFGLGVGCKGFRVLGFRVLGLGFNNLRFWARFRVLGGIRVYVKP